MSKIAEVPVVIMENVLYAVLKLYFKFHQIVFQLEQEENTKLYCRFLQYNQIDIITNYTFSSARNLKYL